MPELILLLLVAGAIVFIGLAASFAWALLSVLPTQRVLVAGAIIAVGVFLSAISGASR